jgi:predicted transcriptional regulator
MTISIEFSPQTQSRLERLASERGQPVEAYVHDLIETSVRRIDVPLDAILAPFRLGFAESGMTEDEATKLLDTAIDEVRAEARCAHR